MKCDCQKIYPEGKDKRRSSVSSGLKHCSAFCNNQQAMPKPKQ